MPRLELTAATLGTALEHGHRHLDTAFIDGNEPQIGEALAGELVAGG